MIALNTTTTSTAKTLNLHGTPIELDGSTVLLRDFNISSNYSSIEDFNDKNGTPKERSWNYITDRDGKNRADENLHDIFLKSRKDGTVEVWNRNNKSLKIHAQADGTISAKDKERIENTICAWEKEALHFSDRKFVAANSAIKGDLSPEVCTLADKPASASSGATKPTGEFKWENIPNLFNPDSSNLSPYSIFNTTSESSAKTVKHPSTFRGITLKMNEKVEVKDLSRVFGSENGKVFVELTEEGYIVSSPALKKKYLVNVNSPKSSQVITTLEKTVRKVETAVDNKIKPNDEDVSKTLRDIGRYQDTADPDFSGELRKDPPW